MITSFLSLNYVVCRLDLCLVTTFHLYMTLKSSLNICNQNLVDDFLVCQDVNVYLEFNDVTFM